MESKLENVLRAVFVVRSETGGWKQLAVVSDGQIAWIELEPALLCGWKVRREWLSKDSDWDGMSVEAIIAWKRDSHPAFVPADEGEAGWALERVAGWATK